MITGVLATPAFADHPTSLVQPTFEEGNVTCSDFFDTSGDVFEAKIEPVNTGTHTDGDFEVLITVKNTADGQVFDYEILSAHTAHGVVVKGGPDANLYDYDAAGLTNVQADVDLHSPFNPSSGTWFGLSHISFCIEDAPVFVEAVLSGVKFLDENEDGDRDAGEAGLGGWVINIYDYTGGVQGALIDSVVTDSNGDWSFTTDPVLEGTELRFLVCEEQQSGWQQTAPAAGVSADGGTCYDVTLTANENDAEVSGLDFGNIIELDVAKNAATEFTRTWTWDIVKDADQTSLELEEGETVTVNYTVDVSATSADSGHRAFGTIVVTNPSDDFSATIQTVTDNQADSVECAEALPHDLGPGESLTCDWETATDQDGSNTATVTATGGFAGGTASASWSFDDAVITEVDKCVDVSDTHVGSLGTVCATDDGAPFSETFEYALTIGNDPDADVFVDCGDTQVVNVASFITDDTGTTGEDDHTVDVTVDCLGEGCTPGFWRQYDRVAHVTVAWLATGYTPIQPFSSVFEDAFPGMTLGQVVQLKGGGLNALGRHTVAALLNAAHPDVDYPMSEAEIISAFNSVFPGSTQDYNALKNTFEELNEAGCPL